MKMALRRFTQATAKATGRWAACGPSSRRFCDMPLPAHINSPGNIQGEDNFQWTAEDRKEIEGILSKYPANYKSSAIIPLLYVAQESNKASGENFLPLAGMNAVAEIVGCHPIKVYEVASFYTMFNRKRVGKYHLQVCGTTPCMVRGSDDVIRACEEHLGVKKGQTTPDGLFTINEVECLAACANAPMMQVNNSEVYEDLSYDNTVQLLKDLAAGNARIGPQPYDWDANKPADMTGTYKRRASKVDLIGAGGPSVLGEDTPTGYVRNTCEGPYGRACLDTNGAEIWAAGPKATADSILGKVLADKKNKTGFWAPAEAKG